MVAAPSGTRVLARGPTAEIRLPVITTTAFGTGDPPFPSITVAPTMATTDCWARTPIVTKRSSAASESAAIRMVGMLQQRGLKSDIDRVGQIGSRAIEVTA